MRSSFQRVRFALGIVTVGCAVIFGAARAAAQGGEPQYFAIRGATVVPVSGPRLENATVVISRGVIKTVSKDATIPDEAWVIEGKGLIVYPGFIDSFTDVGIPAAPAAAASGAEGGAHPQTPASRGPEDRPGATPWRSAADEASLSDKRVDTWRSAGFTAVISAPKGGMFPGQAALLNLGGERNGDMVVKSPVAVPISLQPAGHFSSVPGSLMGSVAYVRQVLLDTDWSTQSPAIYAKNSRRLARPRD